MVQMPTPTLTEKEHTSLNKVYGLYHKEDKAPAWPSGVGDLTSFESNRSDGTNPMTIVARKLRQTQKTKEWVNPTTKSVEHLKFVSTTYDDEKHTFLLYTGTAKPRSQVEASADIAMTGGIQTEIFQTDLEEAKKSWVTGRHFIFYSMALTSTSRTPEKKTKNCVFISILVPCTRIGDITETSITEEQQLGTVQASQIANINMQFHHVRNCSINTKASYSVRIMIMIVN